MSQGYVPLAPLLQRSPSASEPHWWQTLSQWCRFLRNCSADVKCHTFMSREPTIAFPFPSTARFTPQDCARSWLKQSWLNPKSWTPGRCPDFNRNQIRNDKQLQRMDIKKFANQSRSDSLVWAETERSHMVFIESERSGGAGFQRGQLAWIGHEPVT